MRINLILIVTTVFLLAESKANLLLNPDFEEAMDGSTWKGNAASIGRYSQDAYSGTYSCKVSNT